MQLGGHSPPPPPDLVLAPFQRPLHALPLLEAGLVVHAGGYLVVSLGLASLTDLKDGGPQLLREGIVHLRCSMTMTTAL